MSDIEEDGHIDDVREEPEENEEEEEDIGDARKESSAGRRPAAYDDEEEEEDEEEDEDDEEDEDEEGGDPGDRRAKKRRKRRPAVNRYLDLQAEVDEDDEEEDEDEDYTKDDFLEEPDVEGDDLNEINRRAAHHAKLDRRERELSDQDLARIAQDLTSRYKSTGQKYTGDMNEIPQRLLMPSVQDANLWQVRVRPGKERDIVFSLMRKALDLEFNPKPLLILSAFQRDSLPGMIYVEARSSRHVVQACNGLVGVFASRGVTLVPIEEMASLLQIKKKDTVITPGSWVRIKRGKYAGDLAQVMDMTENGEEVGLKFMPRIDLNPKDELSADGKKRKKVGANLANQARPPQRFFNFEEVVKAHGRRSVVKRNQVFVFANDTYRDGYIEKDFKISTLILENVNPTLDEIMRFTRQEDGAEHDQSVDLSIIAETSKKEAISVLQPGDHVEVFEGEQSGVHGIVETIANDVVTLRAVGVDIEGQKVDVPARSVRKRFKPGDHVKVMAGQNADETGLVVSVADNVVTFLSDMSMQEVSVFSKDLREAAEVGSSTNIVGNYELHDLVQLDLQTVGVIFKTERDFFRVLDHNGQVRRVQPHQITMRRDSNRAIATDGEGHELRINDNVKESDGEGRKGIVLHIHQSFYAFLHNREIQENGGVFVARARSLISLAPKGNIPKPGSIDLSKMNPALSGGAQGGMVGSQAGRGPRDYLIGVHVTIIKGPHKGYIGTIKDSNGPIARVELLTGNKVITIDKAKLWRRNPNGSSEPLDSPASRGRGSGGRGRGGMFPPPPPGREPTPNHLGSRTPAWTSRTPNPYLERTPSHPQDGGKTPAWNASSRTPGHFAEYAKTPVWNPSSRTPNPYLSEGSKTPSWNASAHSEDSFGWGGSSGSGSAWNNDSYNSSNWTGATAETPSAWPQVSSAPTPAAIAAPTPAASGYYPETPRGVAMWNKGTPAASAATPANAAPTPWMDDMEPTDSPTESGNSRWLLDSNWDRLENKQRYAVVRIHGSNGTGPDPPWDEGKWEGSQGIVVTVLNMSGNYASTASIKLLPGLTDERIVPLEYLVPVPPDRVNELAISFDHAFRETGPVKVTEILGQQLLYFSNISKAYNTIPLTKCVKYQEW